jgi:uncharacterized lipoprotein YajG
MGETNMKVLTLASICAAAAALTGCYTEPKVTANTPPAPATAVVGAPAATTVVTPGVVTTPAPATTVVVPAR